MSKNYTDVIVFSFGCEDDFQYANAFIKKYPNLYHVVLTSDPDATNLSVLCAKYPHLAHTIVDINDIKEDGTGAEMASKLAYVISNSTKVIIRAHSRVSLKHIESSASEQVTMPELALLLKRNCGGIQNMRIAFHVCCAGIGDAVNRVEGSVAKTLYDQLAGLGIECTISTYTSFMVLIPKSGKKYVMPITMAEEYNTYRRI